MVREDRRSALTDETKPPCQKCGMVHKACSMHRHSDGMPCGRWPLKGALRCRVHGGAASGNIEAAKRRAPEADVRKLLPPRKDWTKVENSLDELYDLASESRAFREALADRVAGLDDMGTKDTFDREDIRAVVQVYLQAVEQSAKISSSIARLNIDERRLALQERQMALVKGTILHALALLCVPMSDTRLDDVMPVAVTHAACGGRVGDLGAWRDTCTEGCVVARSPWREHVPAGERRRSKGVEYSARPRSDAALDRRTGRK
jgi:hypothetical protein